MSTPLVTVFGGTGFVGRHTVRALAKTGRRIRVAVRYPHKGFFLPPNGTVGQIALVKCNATEADQVEAAVRGADAVINLTGVLYSRGENSLDAVHVEAAENIAKAASAAGVRTLVHVSSIGAAHGGLDLVGFGRIALDQRDLSHRSVGRQEEALVRIAHRDADTPSRLGEGANRMATDKAGAAENRDQGRAHGAVLAGAGSEEKASDLGLIPAHRRARPSPARHRR